MEIKIDKNKYPVSENNYIVKEYPKKQIIISNSLRKDNNHIIHLQHKYHGETKDWNTFTISREGEIFEHYQHKYYSKFLGIEEADKMSISIVLENMGYLIEKNDNTYVNLLNEICENENILEKNWIGYTHWEKYSPEQIDSLAGLCKYLCEELFIDQHLIEFKGYHKDIIKYNGIVFKSNYMFESQEDINPLFNIEEFEEKLKIK